jgi:dienelactone hydrolase
MIRHIALHTPHGSLHGQLERPDDPRGLIVLARSHHLPIDTTISANLAARGYAILAMELLTAHELQFVDATQNVPRLTQRLIDILDLARHDGDMQELPLCIFASGEIAPAVIRAAAQRDTLVRAVACHGGLIDRAGAQALDLLNAPLLMLIDADDDTAFAAYRRAATHLRCVHEMQVTEIGESPENRVAIWFSRFFYALRSKPGLP